jgi:hypothetical protein
MNNEFCSKFFSKLPNKYIIFGINIIVDYDRWIVFGIIFVNLLQFMIEAGE